MRLRFLLPAAAVLCLSLVAASASVSAAPVGVNYTVSGSSGAWTLDFSVTNNVVSGQGVYFFGVLLPVQDILASPGGSKNCLLTISGCTLTTWNPSTNDFASHCSDPTFFTLCGGPNINFNNLWINFDSPNGLPFGDTLSGFQVEVNTLTAPTSVQWFAGAFDPGLPNGTSPYTGGGNFTYGPESECISDGYTSCLQAEEENPGFAGTAFVAGATPEPSSLLLLGTGLLGLGPLLRRRSART